MQLGGAAAKCGGGIEIQTDMIPNQSRRRKFGEVERIGEFGGDVFWKRNRCTGLVIAMKLFDGPLPAVAFVGDETLQHGQNRGRSGFGVRAGVV